LNRIKWAISKDQLWTLKAILASGSFDLTEQWKIYKNNFHFVLNATNALECACMEGHLEIVQDLLEWNRPNGALMGPFYNQHRNWSQPSDLACFKKHIAIVHSLLEWTGSNGKKVHPISPLAMIKYETVESVEDNIIELEKKGQSGEQWKNVLHQFVSNPYVNKEQLLEWATSNDKQRTIAAIDANTQHMETIRAHAQQNL